jgi:hypothetical protein
MNDLNPKKCKGISQCKSVEGCGKESLKRTFGLCPSCLWDWATNNENGKVWKEKNFLPKFKKTLIKNEKIKNKELKENLTNWRVKLQTKIQEIARFIDIGLPCLALGYHAGQIQGGHIFSKGSNTTIALNLHNIHRQSAQSNHSHNDDGLLRDRLSEEYGEGYLNFLKSLKMIPSLHYTNSDYMYFYKVACEISNDLKKKGRNFDLKGRIETRNAINIALGIYELKHCQYNL